MPQWVADRWLLAAMFTASYGSGIGLYVRPRYGQLSTSSDAAFRAAACVRVSHRVVFEADLVFSWPFCHLTRSKGHTSRLRQIGTDMRLVSHVKQMPSALPRRANGGAFLLGAVAD